MEHLALRRRVADRRDGLALAAPDEPRAREEQRALLGDAVARAALHALHEARARRAAARRGTDGAVGALAVHIQVEPHGRRRAVDEPDLVGRDRPRLREFLPIGVALRRLQSVADAGDEQRALDEGVARRRAGLWRELLPDPAAHEDLHAVVTAAAEHHYLLIARSAARPVLGLSDPRSARQRARPSGENAADQ